MLDIRKQRLTYLFACACHNPELGVGASGATRPAGLPLPTACLSQGARPSILLLDRAMNKLKLL
jgi:hypothetical protein